MATVGFLHSGSRENFIDAWNAFRKMVPSNVQIKTDTPKTMSAC